MTTAWDSSPQERRQAIPLELIRQTTTLVEAEIVCTSFFFPFIFGLTNVHRATGGKSSGGPCHERSPEIGQPLKAACGCTAVAP